MIHLVLGGARSGKSNFAEQYVVQHSPHKLNTYIATATVIDDEMQQRIEHHQMSRGSNWTLIECPMALADLLPTLSKDSYVLLDCMTLWLNNVLFLLGDSANKKTIQTHIDAFIMALKNCRANITIVSNEVGLGVIPMNALSRLYVDHAGWLNQAIAQCADEVTLVTAGLPLKLKAKT
ncbi:bifunctional adenosylcobinamide kinase/adenosylcobinamide-phosphate guanylyltransferase [Algibacillus agarilyticus]|uniref:bifunctional adenosylcobinamide kinase/adenosylcobinamide-phosphate guanylyltransferase n=1 Tax=Algibacillus agarilyticus TaxID=2234133 RepID=UPI000DCF97E9|nr:bifunctional adenosylcobinamide kinase/adenosylcobinamide-phosphate guanylyltransferase [Algibacillus agarilyticus]